MITDSRGRTIVLITSGAGENRVGAIDSSRPGDTTLRIDIGGSVVQKARDQFRPLAIGDLLIAA
jgi:hypothetical protein